jgi:HK97 family phage prohead protease
VKNIISFKDSSIGLAITDVNPIKGIVQGYFSHFDNVDGDGDIIRKGAFAKTIKEQGPSSNLPRIKHLLNHDPCEPLGKLLSLKEDNTGLLYESQIGTHEDGQDFIKMVESGLITEHSIGFNIVKRNQIQSYEDYMKNPSKGWFEITEVKLYEGSSLTAWGANPLTPIVSLKGSFAIDMIVAQQAAIEKFCRNTDATDETIQALILHSKQLAQHILDLKKGTLPAQATEPSNEILDTIREFNNNLKS